MKTLLLIAIIPFIIACGKKVETKTVTQYVSTTSTPIVDEVARLISEENEYRFRAGQTNLTSGLTCSLYTNLSTALTAFPTSLPSATLTYGYIGAFNQPNTGVAGGINILPANVRALHTSWYAIRCSGYIAVVNSDYQLFNLTSDDASLLYINNVKVVDNNGNHGSITRSGSVLLKRGVHSFRLDYMQGPAGNQSLILENQSGIVPSGLFFR